MDLKENQKNWNEFGKQDPLWSILTHDDKKDNRWQLEEFFRTGQEEIDELFTELSRLEQKINYGRALDFGCGVGRLTQALHKYFDQVDGVDIASSMIKLANKYNNAPAEINYHVNEAEDLKLFDGNSFDFVFSLITLQHIHPRYSQNYIKEFLRILKPGGLIVFQIPSHKNIDFGKLSWSAKLARHLGNITPLAFKDFYYYLKSKFTGKPYLRMYNIPQVQVEALIKENGGQIIKARPDDRAGDDWISIQYSVTK